MKIVSLFHNMQFNPDNTVAIYCGLKHLAPKGCFIILCPHNIMNIVVGQNNSTALYGLGFLRLATIPTVFSGFKTIVLWRFNL